MEISVKTIQHLAHLSRLEISDEQVANYQADMQRMVTFIQQLQALDTNGVAPLRIMADSNNAFRADQITNSLTAKDALKNAPSHDQHYFKVPTVIKK
ncbi:Asp-tRNA(Asn)/Glu-tRNA(Gln) amidotransferase subunit GatC [Sediminibacterium sp.]|uniref:Asp-tRNA(Asn)/Glu-tRNA(Gln) amidotransferase subunit GatC n=1 Tax=Sediminibacterium sp. TaxID=1917865 RepID=UPI003F720C79